MERGGGVVVYFREVLSSALHAALLEGKEHLVYSGYEAE
jgi:hypothetical protein